MNERPQVLLRSCYRMPNGSGRAVVVLSRTHKWEVYTRQGGRYLRLISFHKDEAGGKDIIAEFNRQCSKAVAEGGERTRA